MLQVKCPKDKLIAIHSAMYGYTQPGVAECPSEEAYNTGKLLITTKGSLQRPKLTKLVCLTDVTCAS